MPRRRPPALTPAHLAVIRGQIRTEVDAAPASTLRDLADRLLDDYADDDLDDAEEPADPAPTPPAGPVKIERDHLADELRHMLVHDVGLVVGNDEFVGGVQAIKLRAHDHDRPALAKVDGRRMAFILRLAADGEADLPGLRVRVAEHASHPVRHRGLGYKPARYGITPIALPTLES